MTVPVSDRLSQLYVGNGINKRFDFTFRVFSQESESGVVVRQKTSEGFVTINPSLYTVTVNQENEGGHVDFITPPNIKTYFYIAGATPLDQLLDITNYDNFYPEAIERALDKLTALLQEWGSQLDEEKQERILADIKYDSLAMEREENLENRLTSYINALIGVTNPGIFEGISDRMIITEDGRTQREFNRSIPFWTDDYVNFKQSTYLREEQILDHTEQQLSNVETTLNNKVAIESSRAIAAENLLDGKINANGVGNRAYRTWAEMDADKANIPTKSKVTVTNDPNPDVNGDYQWNGVNFTKSTYDPLTQSKSYTDFQILNKVLNYFRSSTDLNNIFNVFDFNENSALRVAQNGDLFIYGRPDAVQKIIRDLEKKISPLFSVDGLSDLYTLPDKNDIPVVRIDQRGEIFIVGFAESLQKILAKVQDTKNADEPKAVTVFNKKVIYVREYLDMFTQLLASQLSTAAIPHFSSKQQFSLNPAWVDSIKMNLSTQRIVVAGYDPAFRDDIGVVHPQVWSFDKKVGGYKFWLGLNPYTNTNEDIELPFIYGSNDPDFKGWELIPSFPTPFDTDPLNTNGVTSGHCSDSGFVYDIKSGDLLFFWRVTRYRGNRDITTATNEFRASRFDGKKWSEKFTILDESLIIGEVTDYLLSPNIVYNPADNLYHMFTINNNGKMYRRTTNDLNSKQWSARTECTFSNNNFVPWHLDMKFVGDKLVALIHVDTAGANEYRFAVSDDFLNFNVSASSIVNEPDPALYKATFLPVLGQNDFKMKIIYTTDQSTTPNWQLHTAETTTVSY